LKETCFSFIVLTPIKQVKEFLRPGILKVGSIDSMVGVPRDPINPVQQAAPSAIIGTLSIRHNFKANNHVGFRRLR